MFERFTDRARRVVVLAQEEARLLRHDNIGTEHLLLGLIGDGEAVASTPMAELDIEQARREVAEICPPGDGRVPSHIPFTPQAKTVLETALRESKRFQAVTIAPAHVLLALVKEADGVVAQFLDTHGVDEAAVRAALGEEPGGGGVRGLGWRPPLGWALRARRRGMVSPRSDIESLRDEIRELRSEIAELRALLEQEPPG